MFALYTELFEGRSRPRGPILTVSDRFSSYYYDSKTSELVDRFDFAVEKPALR